MKKIFFSASTYAIPELFNNYSLIIKEVENNHCKIILDWVKDWKEVIKRYRSKGAKKPKESDIFKAIDRKKFYEEHTKAIKNCDMVIAEITRPTITVGYQLFYAIANKKPILALYFGKAENLDFDAIKSTIAIDLRYVSLKKYDLKSLSRVMRDFLRKKKKIYKKFNFIITEEIEHYINWLQLKSLDKSKSEVLREKIINELIFNDSEFQDHMNLIK